MLSLSVVNKYVIRRRKVPCHIPVICTTLCDSRQYIRISLTIIVTIRAIAFIARHPNYI